MKEGCEEGVVTKEDDTPDGLDVSAFMSMRPTSTSLTPGTRRLSLRPPSSLRTRSSRCFNLVSNSQIDGEGQIDVKLVQVGGADHDEPDRKPDIKPDLLSIKVRADSYRICFSTIS
jgi:hypothetical protein